MLINAFLNTYLLYKLQHCHDIASIFWHHWATSSRKIGVSLCRSLGLCQRCVAFDSVSGLCPIQPDQPNARPAQRSARETLFWRESSELCHFILFLACGSRFLAIHGRGREWLHRARAQYGKQAGASPARCGKMLHCMTFHAGQRATDTAGGILGAWRCGRRIRYMPVGGFSKKDLFQKNKKSSRLLPSLIRMASIVSTNTARQAGFGLLSSEGC